MCVCAQKSSKRQQKIKNASYKDITYLTISWKYIIFDDQTHKYKWNFFQPQKFYETTNLLESSSAFLEHIQKYVCLCMKEWDTI